MKRKKKNNAFTDALGAELLTRKLTEKAAEVTKKAAVEEQETFMIAMEKDSDFETIAEPIVPTVPVARKAVANPPKQNKKSKTKISSPQDKKISAKKNFSFQDKKISAAEKKSLTTKKISLPKVEPESEFEKRIFAEAENDFYDEKIPQNIGDNMRSKISEKISEEKDSRTPYHSNFLKKQFEELNGEFSDAENEDKPDFDPELYRKLSRAETAGVGLSAIMMIYSFLNLDKPLFFLSLSLFTHLMRPLIGAMCGKYNRSVQNAMRSFSWVLFVGSLILLFMNS